MRHSNFTAVYDACVLYSAPLRDLLMWLGLSGRFRARWSSQIHEEWKRSLLRDRHVLAAAIRCGASVIVTFNEKDFPGDSLEPFGIEAQHPDLFIDNLFDLDPAAVVTAAQRQRGQLKHPTVSVDAYLDVLLRQGLVQTTQALSRYRAIL